KASQAVLVVQIGLCRSAAKAPTGVHNNCRTGGGHWGGAPLLFVKNQGLWEGVFESQRVRRGYFLTASSSLYAKAARARARSPLTSLHMRTSRRTPCS